MHSMYEWTLNAVQGTEYMQKRLGRHILRKGNKYGLWVDSSDLDAGSTSPNKSTVFAHYVVEGELCSAKIVLQVEQLSYSEETIGERKLVLLMAEFYNSDKFVIFELNERSQLPAM